MGLLKPTLNLSIDGWNPFRMLATVMQQLLQLLFGGKIWRQICRGQQPWRDGLNGKMGSIQDGLRHH
jgi:hypothetical protein